mmetsp:Transcript_2633/g.4250  ORF Transcript_2633/g.4250 Transcript_2633/m.4250 type:complete len:465 (-) Transcript_2633:69-1463(-)|eukprot:CAMPEP_0119013764 /NCGR_PEP_ID=MMETSP1176-20130426/8920_1 /TAXON_ID=265551 /ORGANISM="Synedropsis recta cf, Strain CCMP1620" /LENGTH=464 /DNA_ID=CAMNT_0006966881 /DNA_START=174 /DNA_END=1568 /DNA_ORIENTATION=+
MVDTTALTHVAAILVGVAVTLFLVGSLSSTKKEAIPSSTGANASANANATKKKKRKKSKAAAVNNSNNNQKAVPAPAAPPPVKKEEAAKEEVAAATTNSKKKKKKKNGADQKPATIAPVAAPSSKTTTTTTARSAEPAVAAVVAAPSTALLNSTSTKANNNNYNNNNAFEVVREEEEWLDAAPKKKNNRSQRPKAAKAATAVAGAASTDSITIDAKKVGIIIGPKGATMLAIQDATGCKLDVNAPSKDDKPTNANAKATVVLSGDKDAVKAAKKAILELAAKGFATILQSENFGETTMAVHPRYLSEIVGPGGRTIQALQKTLDVKLSIPPTDWKPNNNQGAGQVKPCNVGIAGSKENSKTAKAVIQALMKYHHHEVTHPGMIHEEVYVPSEFFHCVIGPRGSEIKHIRGNYKVDIYMPNAESTTDNVLVVGKMANVDKAIAYINTLMDRDAEQRDRKYHDEAY